MRSKERLEVFYDELKFIHREFFQDLRFGQFMVGLFDWMSAHYGIDPFYPEEDKMIRCIREYAKTSSLYKGQYDWVN